MGDVIQFPRKESFLELFSCANCGNVTVFIHLTGHVECEECEQIIGTLEELLQDAIP